MYDDLMLDLSKYLQTDEEIELEIENAEFFFQPVPGYGLVPAWMQRIYFVCPDVQNVSGIAIDYDKKFGGTNS